MPPMDAPPAPPEMADADALLAPPAPPEMPPTSNGRTTGSSRNGRC